MFDRLAILRSRLEDWKDSLSVLKLGCGCLATISLALLCCARIGGAVMGDYIGPPEGVAEDQRLKTRAIKTNFILIGCCTFTGCWLVMGRRRR